MVIGTFGPIELQASTSTSLKVEDVRVQKQIEVSQNTPVFDLPASQSISITADQLPTSEEEVLLEQPRLPIGDDAIGSETVNSVPTSAADIPAPLLETPPAVVDKEPENKASSEASIREYATEDEDSIDDWREPVSEEDTQLSVEENLSLESEVPTENNLEQNSDLPKSLITEEAQALAEDSKLTEVEEGVTQEVPLEEKNEEAFREQFENSELHQELHQEPQVTAYDPQAYTVPDIEIITNKKIEAFIKMYTKRKRKAFELAIVRSSKYMGMIHRIFKEHNLPLNLAYLAVVESNFNPIARSKAQALGMWQFMSYTGKHFDLHRSWWHDDRYDPEKSTVAAAKYLKSLHRQFKGDWELALAAYNTGGGRVRRAIRRAKRQGKPANFWSLRLPRETRGYVPAFYAVATIFKDLEAYDFAPAPAPQEEKAKQLVNIPGGVPLTQVAAVLGAELKELKELNPSLKRGITPATFATFEIAIPTHVALGVDEYNQLNKARKQFWKYHRVRRGESLWTISRRYQIPIKKIKSFNQMRRNLLRIGQKVMLPLPSDWAPKKYQPQYKPVKTKKVNGLNYAHKVRSGETLWSISRKYAVTLRQLRAWNPRISRSRFLKVGAIVRLKLPMKVAGLN